MKPLATWHFLGHTDTQLEHNEVFKNNKGYPISELFWIVTLVHIPVLSPYAAHEILPYTILFSFAKFP